MKVFAGVMFIFVMRLRMLDVIVGVVDDAAVAILYRRIVVVMIGLALEIIVKLRRAGAGRRFGAAIALVRAISIAAAPAAATASATTRAPPVFAAPFVAAAIAFVGVKRFRRHIVNRGDIGVRMMSGIEIAVIVFVNEVGVDFICRITPGFRRAAGVRSSGIARRAVPLRAFAVAGPTATTAASAAAAAATALVILIGAASRLSACRTLTERLVAFSGALASQYVLLFLQGVAEVIEFASPSADCRPRLAHRLYDRFASRRPRRTRRFGTWKRFGTKCRFATRTFFDGAIRWSGWSDRRRCGNRRRFGTYFLRTADAEP